MRNLLLIVFIFCLKLQSIYSEENPNAKLTRAEAAERSERIKSISYDMKLQIGTEANFTGSSTVTFTLTNIDKPLRLDFGYGVIGHLTVNGQEQKPAYNGAYLTLSDSLKVGANKITITYTHPYSTTGDGLYRFKDPLDQNTYLYTNFEPYAANQLFPCFDQPDLKATYRLTVDAPASWEVISAVRETSIKPAGARRTWTFPESPKFSTYLIALHAGPYAKWESKAGKTPLRLFARRTLAQYMEPKEWFLITQQGFEFYEKYFDVAYPFPKYDQIIIPDFNWSGMENVGAVSLTERYVFRSKPTRMAKLARADLILHELAHMWFGDLVTMKWWDDLWLNESFASYMAGLVMMENTEFKESWQYFNLRMKRWAYGEDRLPTTHAIQSGVSDTSSAFAAFDGITYGKGAATLKQLAFQVGATKFRDGIRIYLKKHKFSNATLADFMAAIQESAGSDLTSWQTEWLSSAGLSGVRLRTTCTSGKLQALTIEQFAVSGDAPVKRHMTLVSFFGKDAKGNRVLLKSLPVTYQGTRTDITIADMACPEFVFPNHRDEDYTRISLDPEQRKQIGPIVLDPKSEPLLRTMLWQILWEDVRGGKMKLSDYTELLIAALKTESDSVVLSAVLENLAGSYQSPSVVRYLAGMEGSGSTQQKIEAVLLDRFKRAADTPERWVWFDALVQSAQSKPVVSLLGRMLGRGPDGIKIDQNRRWAVLLRLSIASAEYLPDVESELKRDPSEDGQKMAFACKMAIPDIAKKREALAEIRTPGKVHEAYLKHSMNSYLPYQQEALQTAMIDDLYSAMADLHNHRDLNFTKLFSRNVALSSCSEASTSKLDAFIKAHPELPTIVQKNLRAALDEDRICITVRSSALGN
ncbi:MAG: aminopeptidase N [Spirochaetia bacterium]|nr:aminopeptidase N [Spirochaetia bacterium]